MCLSPGSQVIYFGPVYRYPRVILNKPNTHASFIPSEGDWHGSGCIRFMLASNVILLVRVVVADGSGRTCGYARLRLGRVGEGVFKVSGEVKESEHVSPQDNLLGYVTVSFKVSLPSLLMG